MELGLPKARDFVVLWELRRSECSAEKFAKVCRVSRCGFVAAHLGKGHMFDYQHLSQARRIGFKIL